MAEADLATPPTFRTAAPKPRMTIYYALLIVSLLAMLTGCLFLYLEIRRFGGFGAVPQRIAAAERPGSYLATEITEDTAGLRIGFSDRQESTGRNLI